MATATALDVKKYFNFSNASEFATEWKKLNDVEKKWFTEELQKEIDAGRWTSV